MPDATEHIATAIRIIGDDDPDDFRLKLHSHAALYSESAPELTRLLEGSEVRAARLGYEELDRRANEARARFDSTSRRARAAVFCTAIFGALLLVAGNFAAQLGESLLPVMLAAAIGGIAAGNLAAMWINVVRHGGLFEEWKTLRMEAEAERLRYFEVVATSPDFPEPLLQLEYFRRYQLGVQLCYFDKRGADHAREAGRILRTGSGALAASGIATGVAGVLAAAVAPQWASLALLAVAAQAVASLADNREASEQNRVNAVRYRRTRMTLQRLSGMLDTVRAESEAGNPLAIRGLVDGVHTPLQTEQQEWQQEMDAAGRAVEQLEALLEEHRDRTHTLRGRDGSAVTMTFREIATPSTPASLAAPVAVVSAPDRSAAADLPPLPPSPDDDHPDTAADPFAVHGDADAAHPDGFDGEDAEFAAWSGEPAQEIHDGEPPPVAGAEEGSERMP